MRTHSLLPAVIIAGSLLLGNLVNAQVVGINSPVTSYASIRFDDTTSLDPLLTPGITSITPTVSPWGGLTHALPLTTDPVTLDFAQGDITAAVILGNYDIALNNVTLNQIVPNTGFAKLTFSFNVEFQIGAGGLASQATLSPIFLVNGTVQSSSGSFAQIGGFINYYAVNTAGTYTVVETVNYNALWNTPGPFSAIVAGIPVNGTTPALVPFTTLTLDGSISFLVDPASINVQTIPEPGSAQLLILAAITGLLWRTRRATA